MSDLKNSPENMKKLKELRSETQISINICLNALKACNFDLDASRLYLRNVTAVEEYTKKADREIKNTAIAHIEKDNKLYVIAIKCETDFVAKNEAFAIRIHNICEHFIKTGIYEYDNEIPYTSLLFGERVEVIHAKSYDLNAYNYRAFDKLTLNANIVLYKGLMIFDKNANVDDAKNHYIANTSTDQIIIIK